MAALPAVPVVVDQRAGAHLWGRPAQLASALRNLIENARQHAAPDTSVTVTVAYSAGGRRFSVHNHGEPISEANLARVWDRFFTTRATTGAAAGLPIVSAVVAAHGGQTFVTSDPVDGTTFGFELPESQRA